jgi:hypothetical protein
VKAAASGRSLEFLKLTLPFLFNMIDLLLPDIGCEAPLERKQAHLLTRSRLAGIELQQEQVGTPAGAGVVSLFLKFHTPRRKSSLLSEMRERKEQVIGVP